MHEQTAEDGDASTVVLTLILSTFKMAALLADRRPPSVEAAVDDHFRDAAAFGQTDRGHAPMRWIRDGLANYDFLAFGEGCECVVQAVERARAAGRPVVSVLDVGCGAGAFVVAAAEAAAAAGLGCYARGYVFSNFFL